MRNWKSLPVVVGAAFICALIIYALFYFVFIDLLVDLWWFRSLELEGYYWLRLLYRFILSGGITIVFFAIFYFHFWIASSYLGLNPPDDILLDADRRERFQSFSKVFMEGSAKVYIPVSFILAIFIALPFYEQWESALLFFFGSSSGVTEPVFENDISFYLFSYPFYALIQHELLITASLLLVMVGALYWLEHIFVPEQNQEFSLGSKIHLTILIAFVVLFVVWGFLLDRFSLLYTDSHEPVFFGPGYVELRYQLPLIWLSIVAFIATSVSAIIFIFSEKHRVKTPLIVSVAFFVIIFSFQKLQIIPDLMQQFIVKPSPVSAEKEFMQNNIDATLDAYDLKNIKTIDFTVKLDATKDIEAWSTKKHFENIPVWDREFLTDGYMQLQGIRPYYRFLSVDEDRYFLNDHMTQVNLAAREMNIKKLPSAAQNWENTHLRYTHGYGAVVTPAAQDAGKPIIWYLRDLNLYSNVGFTVKHPEIYYGQEYYKYAVVSTLLDEADPDAIANDPGLSKPFQGNAGVSIPSYFRKALLSYYLSDEKIFFSKNITRKSRVLLHRNIIERVKTLTPYLHLDSDPYLVITKDRFYWVIDAYTISEHYPVSKPVRMTSFLKGEHEFNYVRNSVKITVDAYNGGVNYYISNPSDPIIQAYSRAYPGVFEKLDAMPQEIQQHLRYPRDLYYLQMKVYAKYHQQEAEVFYEQSETWQFANVNKKEVLPYFNTMDFGNCNGREEFVMINPMTPINRDNLSMVALAGVLDNDTCGDAYTPGITVYKFHKDIQVNGPAQVRALIDQNPEISEQFTLWDQHGSRVKSGRMIILPMSNSVLYVQPIYMISTKTKIPELTRVIVSIGNEVVMDKTLWSAFKRLKSRFVHKSNGSGTTMGVSGE